MCRGLRNKDSSQLVSETGFRGKCLLCPAGHVSSDWAVVSGSGGPDVLGTGLGDAGGGREDTEVPARPDPPEAAGSSGA